MINNLFEAYASGAREIFSTIDASQSGKVTRAELQKVLGSAVGGGEGEVNFEDFIKSMTGQLLEALGITFEFCSL